MLKKEIAYTDYNGEDRTETFYFNFTEAEIAEMELSVKDKLSVRLNRIIETNDTPAIINEFKKIILSAVGKKSDDGRRFIKNPEISEEFEQCPAYSALFMELGTNTDAAIEFVNSLIPTTSDKPMVSGDTQ